MSGEYILLFLGLHAFVAGGAGLVGSYISGRMHDAWGVARDHWLPWYLSLATFALFNFASLYLSIPRTNWRYADVDRLEGWTLAGAILIGHLISYLIVKARFATQPAETEQKS